MIRHIDWLRYRDLYSVLLAHGFVTRPIRYGGDKSGILFRHPSGAELPYSDTITPDENVVTYHYGAARAAMTDYEIMTRDAFDLALLQAAHRLPATAALSSL